MNRNLMLIGLILSLVLASGIVAAIRPLSLASSTMQEGPYISDRMAHTLGK